MKYDRWFGALWAWLLAFCAAFSGVGCLQSGLGLGTNMGALAGILAVAALITALCCVFRLYLVPLGGVVVLCAVFWRQLLDSARLLVAQAGRLYDMAYHWGVPIWEEPIPETASEEMILVVLGCCMICVVTTAMLSGRGLSAAALMTLIPLIPCIVVTDTVPESGFLFFLLLSVLLLLLSNGVRIQSLRKANALLLWLMIPAVLGMVLLFSLVNRETYDGQEGAQKLEDFVISLFDGQTELPGLPQSTVPVQVDEKQQVDLKDVGYNPRLGLEVMRVKADSTGRMYLRGAAYDVYTGTGWKASGSLVGEDMYSLCQNQTRYVTIQTSRVQNVLYIPYVTTQFAGRVQDGQVPNTEMLREYSVAYREPVLYDPLVGDGRYQMPNDFMEVFLQLPQETKSWARDCLPRTVTQLVDSGIYRAAAEELGKLVKASADYDRMTQAMPAGETDFARWFMENSDKGYCVHYATAATVLLRAAGIPARYVTGYLAFTQADLYAPVTTDDAHAWVEYYLPNLGWTVLEVTPADVESPVEPGETEPGATTEGTEPFGTEPTDGTTVPPTDATEPEQTEIATRPSSEEATRPGENVPGQTKPGGEEPDETQRSLPEWVKNAVTVIVILAATAAGIIGQWQLRLWLRRKRLQRGRINARALTRWREAAQMAKLLKREPAEELRQLALKARFSQHMLTDRELGSFDLALAALREELRKKAWYWQLVYRLVFALY